MKKTKTVEEYINSFPKDTQKILKKIRQTIKKTVPDAQEGISYRMPTFKLNDTYLLYFAAWKNHIGLYPNPTSIITFKKELSGYKQSKGAVQFPFDKPFPYDLLKKILKYRIKESLMKKKE